MNELPVEIIGIIFNYADFNLTQLLQLKKTRRKFNHALNSPKLAYLYYGKYELWRIDKMKNRYPKVLISRREYEEYRT